ncbi:hypothetical protein MOQ72_33615 [Saccharopolyspora sp. K220]|uniref:hypothetical protein n=1 Tax=Saccharopolyspora soli TaxID=2926618 RepID=UPI001F563AF5|nr:hypothetical protein [Saccharopolyspora soli]MCI2422377.1 hypothetical protein [Saccharopolyspora soli]
MDWDSAPEAVRIATTAAPARASGIEQEPEHDVGQPGADSGEGAAEQPHETLAVFQPDRLAGHLSGHPAVLGQQGVLEREGMPFQGHVPGAEQVFDHVQPQLPRDHRKEVVVAFPD